jgi:DNA (cytosine-5)-methyltransferase 1
MTKPPYEVPTLAAIRAAPRNGLTVASTFAGGGGSSTGYRMSGFKVVYACEIAEAAQATYAANMADYTVLDRRNIRDVTPEQILDMTGLKAGELDLFDGSPPCDSFSLAGAREGKWGKQKSSADTTQRTDDLFFEYIRVLRGLKPRTFVAENVSGLLLGTAKGYFIEIMRELKASGYHVQAQLVDGQWLGLPQSRKRVIFVGVRDDLGFAPVFPKPLGYRYSIRDVLPYIRAVNNDTGGDFCHNEIDLSHRPAVTVTGQSHFYTQMHDDEAVDPGIPATPAQFAARRPGRWRKLKIPEVKALCGFPPDYALQGTYHQQWDRCGLSVPPVMMAAISAAIRDHILLPWHARAGCMPGGLDGGSGGHADLAGQVEAQAAE